MRIALLGGSFDPPHLGHYLIAKQVCEHLPIDQVWFLPNNTTTAHHKIFQKQLSSAHDRLTMATLLEDATIKISDFEITRNPTSLTIVTLEMIEKNYPQHQFYWITGSDKLETFQKYDRWQDIVQSHTLIIFPREHMLWELEERVKTHLQLQTIPKNVIVMHNKSLALTNISSSLVRERVQKGLSIKYLVTEEVEEYIRRKGLYKISNA